MYFFSLQHIKWNLKFLSQSILFKFIICFRVIKNSDLFYFLFMVLLLYVNSDKNRYANIIFSLT